MSNFADSGSCQSCLRRLKMALVRRTSYIEHSRDFLTVRGPGSCKSKCQGINQCVCVPSYETELRTFKTTTRTNNTDKLRAPRGKPLDSWRYRYFFLPYQDRSLT